MNSFYSSVYMHKVRKQNFNLVLCTASNRLIQYACRGLWDSMKTSPWNAELIDKLKTLEYLLSSFRKCEFIANIINSMKTECKF